MAEKKPSNAEPRISISRLPILGIIALILSWLALESTGPTLYESNARVNGDVLVVTITNKGRAAKIGDVWCGSGAYISGTAGITKVASSSPEIFRRTMLAPDQQETLEMIVPRSINPKVADVMRRPDFLKLNASTIWGVACVVPYWDGLLSLRKRELNFCYEVQPAGATERQASMCTPDELSKTISALRHSN